MTKFWTYSMSVVLSAVLAALSGAVLAGQINPGSTQLSALTAFGQDEIRQSDPGSPPDCKKYPKDPRCKGKEGGGLTPGSMQLSAVTGFGQDEIRQSDPGTPPDCKKFPKDPRCKDQPK